MATSGSLLNRGGDRVMIKTARARRPSPIAKSKLVKEKVVTPERMEKAIRDLEDALVVQGHLEGRLSRGLYEAAAWLEALDQREKEHEKRFEEQEASEKASQERLDRIETTLVKTNETLAKTNETLAEATDKLNALISFVAGQHNFPEA